jgi:hypothetical protein
MERGNRRNRLLDEYPPTDLAKRPSSSQPACMHDAAVVGKNQLIAGSCTWPPAH